MRDLWPILILGLLTACDGGEDDGTTPDDRTAAILALTGDAAAGQGPYDAQCALCHAADGSGGTGPAIAGAPVEEVVEAMLYPEGTMPAYDSLGDQEIADIAAWVAAL